MGEINRWWADNPDERYWLEITDRRDLGQDLHCPQVGEEGQIHVGYELINDIRPGDCVFHYDKRAGGIVAWSLAVGGVWSDQIVWAAHSKAAARKGIRPHPRPGWRLGLENFTQLRKPVTLEAIQSKGLGIAQARTLLEKHHGRSLYFPIQLRRTQSIRPVQVYLAKFPSALVELFGLEDAAAKSRSTAAAVVPEPLKVGIGADYRPANESAAVAIRDPFHTDPSIVERGIQGHAATQNALADSVRQAGLRPRSPLSTEPNFDLAWEADGVLHVVEVKSITPRNEEKQLRLGLGQVLRYAHVFRSIGREVIPVLAVESEPTDRSWAALCQDLGVSLVCPHDEQQLSRLGLNPISAQS